ncbi:MAG: SH3 domain-containing protein [Planctomycetaceae bacterium]|nr:SH3 domain-containing protein [Planctomycetaceae bacterium]
MKLILGLVAAAFFATPLYAREVPFDVVVTGDSALVWSGAGEKDYYPTQKLTRGDKVRVIREGYGGWYMIEPPKGSHSWIRAEFVKRKGTNKGIATESTIDRIGSLLDRSDLSIIHKVAEGEVVTILGKATMRSRSGSVEMLKIAPPRGEYRYINHRDVTPADEYTERPHLMASPQSDSPASGGQTAAPLNSLISRSSSITDSNSEVATGPFGNPISIGSSDPSEVGPSVAESAGPPAVGSNAFEINGTIGDSGQSTSTSGSPGFQTLSKLPDHLPGSARQGISMPGVHFEAPQPIGQASIPVEDRAAIENAWQNVMQTDGRFRQMLRQPVSQWNLGSLKTSYTASADKLSSPSLKRQVENRIAAVDRYQKLHVDQIAIEQILSKTETRDAAIRQSYITKWHSVSTTNPPTTRILKPIAFPGQPSAPGPAARAAESLTGTPAKYAGAGVVQRSALSRPGIPSHVLLAPDGRVLSYLQAGPGINLDQHIGKSVGITGARGFRRELNADLMIVRGLTPVKLQP